MAGPSPDLVASLVAACEDGARLDWLRHVVSRDGAPDGLDTVVDDLLGTGVLSREPGRPDVVRAGPAATSTFGELDEPSVARIHEQLAEAIAATEFDATTASRLQAGHLARAGRHGDAARHLVDAANALELVGDACGALDCLDEAARLAQDAAAEAGLLERRADLAASAPSVDPARTRSYLVQLVEELADVGARTRQARALVYLYWSEEDGASSALALERAAALGAGDARPDNGWALLAAGRGCVLEARYADAVPLERRALQAARADGDRELEAFALVALSFSLAQLGRLDEAVVAARQGRQLALPSRNYRLIVLARHSLVELLNDNAEPEAALEECRALRAFVESSGNDVWRPAVDAHEAMMLARCGRLREAVPLADQALGAAPGIGMPFTVLVPLFHASACLEAGISGASVELSLGLAERASAELAFDSFDFEVRFARARLALLAGEPDEALAGAAGLTVPEGESMARLALWLARTGAWHARDDFLQAADRVLGLLPDALPPLARLSTAEAHALLRRDDPDAPAALTAASTAWSTAGRPVEAARALVGAGMLLASSGHPERATRALLAAYEAFAEAGATADLDEVTRALRQSLGIVVGRAALEHSELFEGLTPRELTQVQAALVVKRFRAGHVFFTPDDPVGTVYLLRTGRVRLSTEGADDRQLVVAILDAGAAFGEGSILDEGAVGLRAEAVDDGEVGVLPSAQVRELVQRVPRLGLNLLGFVSRRLRESQQLAEAVAYWSVERRLARLVLELDDRYGHPTLDGSRLVNHAFTQEQLGEMIGATRRAVAGLLAEWRAQGVVELRRRRIAILDPVALRGRLDHAASSAASKDREPYALKT